MINKEIIVSISLGDATIQIGKLWFHVRNGKESASFEYEQAWLNHPEKFSLEPALALTEGSFHTKPGSALFGAIGDSAPDRWGRVLMRRGEVQKAKNEDRQSNTLFEIDYLLGVNDEARQGALRFSCAPESNIFLAQKEHITIPPLVSLPKLLAATENFLEDNDNYDDLKLLLAPGSSLGGARPKASIRDNDGSLAIAKFPKHDDEFNIVKWEAVALKLAKLSGINVPEFRLVEILGKSVLIIKRFDRDHLERIPFLSAMSMIGAKDNELHSYIEIAYALIQTGSSPNDDLMELWRRIVFSIMISNTDDHLRNHGFLYERHQGWRLSPIYDINPTPREIAPNILSTAIDFDNTVASLELALSVAEEFRISKKQAHTIIEEVSSAVHNWREVAMKLGIRKNECDRMSSAFELAY